MDVGPRDPRCQTNAKIADIDAVYADGDGTHHIHHGEEHQTKVSAGVHGVVQLDEFIYLHATNPE